MKQGAFQAFFSKFDQESNLKKRMNRIRIILITFTAIISLHSYSQNIDSLMLRLGRSSDQNKPVILLQIGEYYKDSQPERAITYTQDAIEQALKKNDKIIYTKGLIQKSKIFALSGKYEQAVETFYSAIVKLRKEEDHDLLSLAYSELGDLFEQLGNYTQSLNYYLKASQYDSLSKNTDLIQKSQLNIIRILNLNNQYEEALSYLKNNNIDQIDPKNDLFWDYNLILATTYCELKRFDHVFSIMEKLLAEAQKDQNNTRIAIIHRKLAHNYSLIYNYLAARENYYKSAKEFESTNKPMKSFACFDSIASILIIEGKYTEAKDILLENIQNRKQNLDSTGVGNSYLLLSVSYSKLNDEPNQLTYLDRCVKSSAPANIKLRASKILSEHYTKVNDVMLANYYENIVQAFQTELLEQKYKNKLLAGELALLFHQKELSLAPSESGKQRFGFLIYIVAGLLLISLFVIANAFKSRTKVQLKNNSLISGKNKMINELEEQIEKYEKQNENLVVQRTEELQSELKERRKVDIELKKALKKAEDANYVKNAFLANMSHEIRTPLNGIIGFSSLLETELSLLENQELFEYANSISESGERLLHLLNNIIDISRIEANDLTISLTSCNVNDIVKSASELFKFKANEKGLRFNVKLEDEIPSIMVDEKSLSKIASDIIDNAVKYTEKGFINIVSGIEDKRNEVYFKVKDTGVGIDEAYLPNVFEAFRQESLGYSRAYQGAGLGLPLAKRLVELMNGRIEIESKKAAGTLVSIYFPIKGSLSATGTSELQQAKEFSAQEEEIIVVSSDKLVSDSDPYIFVVEDDRMNRLVIKKMLEKDWRFEIADDGDQTMKMIEEYYKKGIIFDIMLFDINLPPPWDGIKLMHEIKKKYKEYSKIPFVAQTAYAMSGDRERLLEAGFDDYIPKPINRNILVNSIKNQLKS